MIHNDEDKRKQDELKSIKRHFAIAPVKCRKCGRDVRFEFTYRAYFASNILDMGLYPIPQDLCKECCSSKEDALKLFKP